MFINVRAATVAVITAAAFMSVILATPQLPKVELKNYSKNVLTTPMFFKELRSWRLNNLIDYISGKRKARKDLTKPKLKILSKVKGKYKSKIYQIHRYIYGYMPAPL